MVKYLWLIFTALFFFLACFHFYRARQFIKRMPKISGVKTINGVSIGIVEFQETLDQYVKQLNRENRLANTVTAVGYLITAATALFSYFIA